MLDNRSNADVVGSEILACCGGYKTEEHVIVCSRGEGRISASNSWRVNRLDRGHDLVMVREVRLRTGSGQFRPLDIDAEMVTHGRSKRTATDYRANMGLPKWWLKSILASVVGIVGVLFIMHEDIRVHADVLIDRPPSDVWDVISDSAAYPDWNPFITRVDGDFREGATIRIVLGSGSDSMVFKPTVLLVRPGQDLCWRGSVWIRGVFDGKHCIHLTAVHGGTHLEQTERFSGLLVGRLTKDVIEDTRRSFQAMNTAVKQRAESKAP